MSMGEKLVYRLTEQLDRSIGACITVSGHSLRPFGALPSSEGGKAAFHS